MKRIYHVTHNDGDAIGCDVLLRLCHLDDDTTIITKFCSYNTISDTLVEVFDDMVLFPDDDVILMISDISPAEGTRGYDLLLDMMTRPTKTTEKSVFMYDHHKTNSFKGITPNGRSVIRINDDIVDAVGHKVSATWIMFDEFRTNKNLNNNYVKKFALDISNYDTWVWQENPSKYGGEDAVTNVLKVIPPEILVSSIVETLSNKLDYVSPIEEITCFDYLPTEYHYIQHIVSTQFTKYMDTIGCKLKISKSGEYLYGLLVCDDSSINMSLVTDCINRRIIPHMLDYIVILFPATRNISFRTIKDNVDVARIAKRCYGGGGHQKAAGAKVDIPTFSSFLMEYWTANSLDTIQKHFYTSPNEMNDSEIIKFISGEEEA